MHYRFLYLRRTNSNQYLAFVKTSDFDYFLPPQLIAAEPPAERGGSRLLVLDRNDGHTDHRMFADLPSYLRAGDVLVLNDSRVLRARLRGHRADTGGAVELLLLARTDAQPDATRDSWNTMARPAKKLKPGERLVFAGGALTAKVIEVGEQGERVIRFDTPDVLPALELHGEMPLPPYIVQRRRELESEQHIEHADDAERYQTVFAREPGSVAAPTAGLHFSDKMLAALRELRVHIAYVTLHVGAGTFKPVDVEDPSQHPMHSEHYTISSETAATVNKALKDKRRIVAVGTTAVRTLESAYDPATGQIGNGTTNTRMLILPGYEFQVIGGLLTNFHLPKSTLLMLVSAFANRESVLAAYAEAIEREYRFYSYGDAMLIT